MRKKKYLVLVIISLVTLLGMGVSYAYWRFTTSQSVQNIGITKCLKLSITNESKEINLDNLYPISDEEGRKLTPYNFTLTNTCSMSADYSLNLEVLEGTTLNSKYLDVLVNNNDIKLLSNYDTTSTVINNSVESRTLDRNILTPGASKDYQISFWIDKDVTINDDAMNKVFKSKVVINATATHTVVDNIVASLDTTGKCPTVNSDGTVNVTSTEKDNSLLCSASDAYGTSYYYRGTVENNYVYFANFYWRIVRINGDGSIRLIYDGTTVHENGELSEDKYVGTTKYNIDALDNSKVGYMYGNSDGIVESTEKKLIINDSHIYYLAKEYIFNSQNEKFSLKDFAEITGSNINSDYIGYYLVDSTDKVSPYEEIFQIVNITDENFTVKYIRYGTTSKEQAQTNTNDSKIKIYLDNWYKNNIKDTSNERYVADNIFCNDRRITQGGGFGSLDTYYWTSNVNEKLLICLQKNDAFTVNDINTGNGDLTYPIGLLTASEYYLAGGGASYNSSKKFYLYTGSSIYSGEWTMSPFYFLVSAHMRATDYRGYLDYSVVSIANGKVRPVINIKPDTLKSGDGTMDNPYTVE